MDKFFNEAFVVCKVVSDEEGNLKLDLPFPIYHMTITYQNTCRYCYLSQDLKDKEVLAYIHYFATDEAKVKADKAYLGDTWKTVSTKSEVAKHWAVKKEDAYAVTSELGTVSKYEGKDKLNVVHPYMAIDIKEA
jgi:hypothetical protein